MNDAKRLVTVVIVTFNRRELLERCLKAIANQTNKPQQVLIIDNASTDGTQEWVEDWLVQHIPQGRLSKLDSNIGGAGGFAHGMEIAMDGRCDWVWMMDDDAEPCPDALEQLLKEPLNTSNIYSSVAISGENLAWPIIPSSSTCGPLLRPSDLRPLMEVSSVPFLGILISAELIKKIGYPDAGYFFQFDDVEYCLRSRKAGASIILIGSSRINHPLAKRYPVRILGKTLYTFRMMPWKRYYYVRNRILLAKKHFGLSAYYNTVPASFFRLIGTLINEPNRILQTWATIAGVWDGLWGRKGQRHKHWGLRA